MNIISNYHIFPFTNDEIFEIFVSELFNELENTNSFERYGSSGQQQKGIDIISNEKGIVIQCKLKDPTRNGDVIRKELLKGLNRDFKNFIKFNTEKKLGIERFIFATTWKKDVLLTNECIQLSQNYNIKVEYWSWTRLLENMNESLYKKFVPEFIKDNEDYYYPKITALVGSVIGNSVINGELSASKIDKSKPLLTQLYEYLQMKFKEVKVLPSFLFINEYPFRTDNKTYSYRYDFTLRIGNIEIVELFNTFTVENSQLIDNFLDKEDYRKAKFILETLSQNHIFNIQGKKRGNFKSIRVISKYSENNLLDNYEKFKFIDTLNSLPVISNDNIADNLEAGYFYYKIGELIKSEEYFKKTREIAKKENEEISILICNHNLYNLGILIEFNYYDLANKDRIVEELKSINIEETEISKNNKGLKDRIVNQSFFNNSQQKIQTGTNKIIDLYYSYLRGGWSSANYEWEILYQYATLSAFLNKNYIIFDEYSDYADVVHNLIESIFASYAIKNSENKINSIDDYLLSQIILYADTSEVEKYYKRYYLNKIKYNKTIGRAHV